MNIHLILAMQAEASHIIQKLNLSKLKNSDNIDVFQGKLGIHTVYLFVNQKRDGMDKVGTVPAALLTYKAIKFRKPDLILNLGTCGGIDAQSVNVFDIICANHFLIYHDSFTGSDEKSLKQGLGFWPCIDYHKTFKEFKHGVIASSNSLILHPYNWAVIKKYKVLCVDMEAAAVAEVANEFSIPFSACKVVTDMVYETNPTDALPQFEANFHKAMDLLAHQLSVVVFS